ncbi:MAG: nodulation protein NfeD [Gemmatimonadales bacterium]|nr:MAG: nodulation protein NfeD [Gemmatimonadales bacterium]
MLRLAGLAGLLLSSIAHPLAGQEVVYRIPITGTIENGLAPYVARAIREAAAARVALVYLDIDTPGGRVDAAERIADAIRKTDVDVVAFVNPRAYSAGALIALASDGIYMRPGGVIGAATPVDGGGTKAPEKYVSAMRAEFRALAEEQGLDPRVAEAMVDESIEIPGVVPAGKLLTLSTGEAIELGFAKGEVADERALLSTLGLSGAQVVTPSINWAESLVRFLTNPVVAPLLLSLGMLGLVLEIKAGAFGLGGLVSLGALGLFFGSNLLLGLAGWEELIVLAAGVIALAVEVFIIPGFGIAGVLGILLIGSSVVMAMLGNIPTLGDVTTAVAVLGSAVVITLAVFYAWFRHLPSSNRFKGLLLKGGLDREGGVVSAPERKELIGQIAVSTTDLRPAGTARVGNERIDVVTEGDFIASGSRVQILRAEGYRLVVRQAAD